MARDSRPPGFDMTYRPQGRKTFGPPLFTWALPVCYLTAAMGLLAFILMAQASPSGSWMFKYVVEQDAQRLIGANALAIVVLVGAVAAVVRTAMRGVVIHPDGIEARYVINLGWPKVKNLTWMEIDRVVFDGNAVALHLWDGTQLWLPPVRDLGGMSDIIERVAAARAIPVRGGSRRYDPDDD